MMAPRIIAGLVADINPDSGQWLIVDVGFSSNEQSCGVWNGAGEPYVVTFGDLVRLAIQEVQEPVSGPLNLLLEAPLSVAFRENGNPTRRVCDTQDGRHRDWYVNAGATTLIAAGYLLLAVHRCQRQREVRLFEGFVSFRHPDDRPTNRAQRIASHIADVWALRNAVWNHANANIFGPGELQQDPNDHIESAFSFLDGDIVPPVIRYSPLA